MYRLVVFVLMLVVATPALGKAKGKKRDEPQTIEMCGLASIDAVFIRVAAIDEKLTNAKSMLGSAKHDLTTALNLGRGATIQDAMADLKAKAGGQLVIRMKGAVPKLEAKGAVPTDVEAAIGAVNGMVVGITGSIVELKAIPTEAAALATEAAKLPGRLKDEAKAAGLKPTEMLAKLKIVKKDIEVTAALPEKAVQVVERMTALLAAVSALAPAK